jgi:hypothetical protein
VTPEQRQNAGSWLTRAAEFLASQASQNTMEPNEVKELFERAQLALELVRRDLEIRSDVRIEQAVGEQGSPTREQIDDSRMISVEKNFDFALEFEKGAEKRRADLAANIEKLEAVFNERHKDADAAQREALHDQLSEKFAELRQRLEKELDEKFRRALEAREDPSR